MTSDLMAVRLEAAFTGKEMDTVQTSERDLKKKQERNGRTTGNKKERLRLDFQH